VSEVNGTTFALRKVQTSTPGDSDPSIGIGADGTTYFGYQSSDGTARVAVSNDKGKTWLADHDVDAQLGVTASSPPWSPSTRTVHRSRSWVPRPVATTRTRPTSTACGTSRLPRPTTAASAG
jgi:hypothetical protein